MYLTKPKSKDDADNGSRVLQFHKNNYGRINSNIVLEWSNGLYLPVPSPLNAGLKADPKTEAVFIDLLRRYTDDGRVVSSKSGKNYAPALFADEAEAKAIQATSAMLADAMLTLFAAKRIREVQYGTASRMRTRLEIVE
jgi:hypothetical protein